MDVCKGINAFGFNDSVDGQNVSDIANRPASVILPSERSSESQIRVGKDADESRIEIGCHWPLESQMTSKPNSFHRLPVSLVWENFVNNKDRRGRFGTFYAEEILKAHIDSVCPPSESNQIFRVISIPNSLGTSARERLLRTFGVYRSQVHLLWRPIAAVLGWLSKLNRSDFPTNEQGGWVGVCYLGTDGFEFTRVRLDLSNPDYVIPVRDRPKTSEEIQLNGFDLAGSLGADLGWTSEQSLMWQGLLRLPDVWNRIRQKSSPDEAVLWSTGNHWAVYSPVLPKQEDYGSKVYVPPSDNGGYTVPWVWQLTQRSSKLINQGRWTDVIMGMAKKAFKVQGQWDTEACYGIIICGALAPDITNAVPAWVRLLAQSFQFRTTFIPQVKSISIVLSSDLISLGANVFGTRVLNNRKNGKDVPTYLDVLPQISLYVSNGEELIWQNLFNTSTCCGDETEKNTLDLFSLRRNSSIVDIWLQMSDEDSDEKKVDADNLEASPYRFSRVSFEKTYPNDIPLFLEASMQPSSGFATVMFKPKEERFNDILRQEGVRPNFEEMVVKRESELPVVKRSYPPDSTRKLIDKKMLSGVRYWDTFIESFQRYLDSADTKNLASCLRRNLKVPGKDIQYVINERGEQHLLSEKMINQLIELIENGYERDSKWICVSSWLWEACPKDVRYELRNMMLHQKPNVLNIGYAARVALCSEDYVAVIDSSLRHIKKNQIFKPNLAKALTWMLDFKPKAIEELSHSMKYIYELEYELERYTKQYHLTPFDDMKFSTFQWYPGLLACLLKIRRFQEDFLRKDEDVVRICGELDSLLAAFETFTRYSRRKTRVIKNYKILGPYYQAIKDYLKGCGNNVPIISEDLDEGDEDE